MIEDEEIAVIIANAVAVSLRAHLANPLVPDSELNARLNTLLFRMPTSFAPLPAHRHLPHPLSLVYIWLV